MRELKQLLNSILGQTIFHVPFVGDLTRQQLRDTFERRGWPPTTEMLNARSAQPIVSEESLSQLVACLEFHLEDFVDPESDSIGHAFPAGYDPSKHVYQNSGLVGEAWVSSIGNFARSLLKGAAVLGPEAVTQLLSGWLREQSVEYKTRAVLNALPVYRPLQLEDGVRIDPFPLSTDDLPANLPGHIGMSAEEYLGRTMLTIDCNVSPAFFRPTFAESKPDLQVDSKLNVGLQSFCHALALESNSYVDVAIYFNDFLDAGVFPLSNNSSNWHGSITGLKKRPYQFSLRHSPQERVTKLVPEAGGPVLGVCLEQLSLTLGSLAKARDAAKTRVATERWITSKDLEKSLIDKFIDLRIALESLYLQHIGDEKYRGEMGLRLSLCGAWHLGADYEERKSIRKELQDTYHTASKAVHGGNLEDATEIQKLLSGAQELCRRGILKILRDGYPSQEKWRDLILGAEYDEESA